MELVNKFDNALAGVAGDSGAIGPLVNSANFLETGSFWDMRHCEPADGESHDNNQTTLPTISAEQQDALFGAIASLGLPVAAPIYPPPDHCNNRGLTTLGEHTIKELAERHILFDPDHLSVKARNTALDQTERMGYQGVLSSHSWSTPDAYPRIYEQGGFIAPYAGDSTGFVEKWRKHVGWADPRYYFGLGFGADINGLGAQGDPRGADVPNKVTYPFKGLGGVTVRKQTAGQRTWDINVDGVAQYGLYPDWVEDLAQGRRQGRRRDHRGHDPRRRGLPADVGAGRGHQAGLVPQRRPAQVGHARSQSLLKPRHDDPGGDAGGRPALHPLRPDLRLLRQGTRQGQGDDDGHLQQGRQGEVAASAADGHRLRCDLLGDA